jgi:hypothetical protein
VALTVAQRRPLNLGAMSEPAPTADRRDFRGASMTKAYPPLEP